jgi:hypothetical protein
MKIKRATEGVEIKGLDVSKEYVPMGNSVRTNGLPGREVARDPLKIYKTRNK